MSRIIHFSKTHWKKLGIAAIPFVYGAKYVKEEYQIYNHMRNVCNVVTEASVSPKATNILVVLNPVANKKSCEKMFKKYCEPILHMAGYSVNIIKTEHIGHAKSLMETLNQLPDALVVAGGEGTSSEVVTGLLRRNTEVCPILFLPLGEGFTAKECKGKVELVKNLLNSVLALIHERVKSSPVVKYEIIQSDNVQENHKPIFGLHGLSWGVLSDVEISKEKYWYLGGLKYLAAIITLNMSNKFEKGLSAKLVCTPPCIGCKKCIAPLETRGRSNFSKLFEQRQSTEPFRKETTFESKTCGIETSYNITGKQVEINCNSNKYAFSELSANIIQNISESTMLLKSLTEFKTEPTMSYKGNRIELHPLNSQHQTYYIDGEGYDARPIKISFLPNAIQYFC